MNVPFRTDWFVADILRGTVGTTPRAVSPHRLPLCTYCDHSHLEHVERPNPDKPGAVLRPCRHDPPCECRDFRDPDVKGERLAKKSVSGA